MPHVNNSSNAGAYVRAAAMLSTLATNSSSATGHNRSSGIALASGQQLQTYSVRGEGYSKSKSERKQIRQRLVKKAPEKRGDRSARERGKQSSSSIGCNAKSRTNCTLSSKNQLTLPKAGLPKAFQALINQSSGRTAAPNESLDQCLSCFNDALNDTGQILQELDTIAENEIFNEKANLKELKGASVQMAIGVNELKRRLAVCSEKCRDVMGDLDTESLITPDKITENKALKRTKRSFLGIDERLIVNNLKDMLSSILDELRPVLRSAADAVPVLTGSVSDFAKLANVTTKLVASTQMTIPTVNDLLLVSTESVKAGTDAVYQALNITERGLDTFNSASKEMISSSQKVESSIRGVLRDYGLFANSTTARLNNSASEILPRLTSMLNRTEGLLHSTELTMDSVREVLPELEITLKQTQMIAGSIKATTDSISSEVTRVMKKELTDFFQTLKLVMHSTVAFMGGILILYLVKVCHGCCRYRLSPKKNIQIILNKKEMSTAQVDVLDSVRRRLVDLSDSRMRFKIDKNNDKHTINIDVTDSGFGALMELVKASIDNFSLDKPEQSSVRLRRANEVEEYMHSTV